MLDHDVLDDAVRVLFEVVCASLSTIELCDKRDTKIAGIIGMDMLYICHTIIDLDSMNLFLK